MVRHFSIACSYLSLLAMLLIATGCGNKDADNDDDSPSKGTRQRRVQGGAATTTIELLKAASLDGVIRGRVLLQGDKPAIVAESRIAAHNDHAVCEAGSDVERMDQKWIIGPDGGVANVVVFLKAPAGKYFPIKDSDKERKKPVVLDQPHCAFIPHVAAAFPDYKDSTGVHPTGEQLIVKNDAPVNHNTAWRSLNNTGNVNLKSGGDIVITLIPETSPVKFNCDIHPWMNAFVWTFEHPYFAVTKEDGHFEIKDVPTDVEVGLVAWHEVPGFFNGGKDGLKQKFKPGENKIADLKVPTK